MSIGRTARFREIYDRKTFRLTSLTMRTSRKTHSLVCAHTDLRWRNICARVIAYVTPSRKGIYCYSKLWRWWSLLSLRKMSVPQSLVVLLDRWRLLCKARPILDLHSRPQTVNILKTVVTLLNLWFVTMATNLRCRG